MAQTRGSMNLATSELLQSPAELQLHPVKDVESKAVMCRRRLERVVLPYQGDSHAMDTGIAKVTTYHARNK